MIGKSVHIGELELKVPLIQGGMGVGVSLGGLAGAVAAEGGMGVISSAQIGYREKDFYENTLAANLRAIHKEIHKARQLAHGGVIGMNIMVALSHYKEMVVESCKAGVDAIISGAGLATELPEYVDGYKTKIAPIVSSQKSARVILKLWDKHFHRTADFIVIEGPKAGGHLGFSKEEVEEYIPKEDIVSTYDKEIVAIVKTVKEYREKYQTDIPVFVAGGISQKADVEHILTLGADGIQVGTRFVTTKECDAADAYKLSYVTTKKEDIKIVKSPVGMPGRAIENNFMKQVFEGKKFMPKKCLGCLKSCNPTDIPYCITERLISAVKGEVDDGLLFCGANAYKENRIRTVREVVKEFFE